MTIYLFFYCKISSSELKCFWQYLLNILERKIKKYLKSSLKCVVFPVFLIAIMSSSNQPDAPFVFNFNSAQSASNSPRRKTTKKADAGQQSEAERHSFKMYLVKYLYFYDLSIFYLKINFYCEF
jgi:hypothetical protein